MKQLCAAINERRPHKQVECRASAKWTTKEDQAEVEAVGNEKRDVHDNTSDE